LEIETNEPKLKDYWIKIARLLAILNQCCCPTPPKSFFNSIGQKAKRSV